MFDVIMDTLIDSVKLLPFLLLTYVAMEYLEHRTSSKTKEMVQKSGKFGPAIGSFLGAFPQCGFSAAASNLYAGRVITLGTLISIYLSTSDEMLPILISEQISLGVILQIIGFKIIVGMIAGFAIDWVMRKNLKKTEVDVEIGHMCEHEHCHCEKSIIKSAIKHTLVIMAYILVISFALNTIIFCIGEDNLSNVILNAPIIGNLLASLVGLIPNCASSVVITQMYIKGIITTGSMLAGLLSSAGVGLLILFKVNYNLKENLKIVGLVYGIGVVVGIVVDMIGFVIK